MWITRSLLLLEHVATNSRAQRPSSEGKCQDFKAAEEGRHKPRVTGSRRAQPP